MPRAVILGTAADSDPDLLLRQLLSKAEFWESLETACRRTGRSREDLRIVIHPDWELYRAGDSTGTDPEWVERLVDALHDGGCGRVSLVGTRDASSLWLENRDVAVLAELVGYRYSTPKGRAYDVVDLCEDLVPVVFPEGSVFGETGMGRAWMEADFRIEFAKSKTHEEHGFALGLQNLIGLLPLRDKDYHYRHRWNDADVTLEVYKQAPPHFALIDAWVSNHGSAGTRAACPLPTRTLVASPDMLLADWVGSLKMGLDPHVSAPMARALRVVGLPVRYEIDGDLSPYPGWIPVPPLMRDAVRRRNAAPGVGRLVRPWLQSVDRECFPFKHVLDDRANAIAFRFLSDPDRDPLAYWGLLLVNHLAAAAQAGLESSRINWQKDQLRWRETPLDFDPRAYSPTEYRAVVDYLVPLQRILKDTPPEPNGLRWRYLDGSVLFEFSNVTPVAFESFVEKVDIALAVQSMNDYIGGACVPVERDSQGRVVLQAERNIYLPQPNWIAFFGGKYIDVGKLEYVEYSRRSQRIYWRTIRSSNGSAEFDDGIVTFQAEGKSATRVTIMARQKFALPLFWQVVNLDLAPRLKDPLVVDAYTRYFRRTIANLEARYQGRDFRIGRPWNPDEGEGDSAGERPFASVAAFVQRLGQLLQSMPGGWDGILERLGFSVGNGGSSRATGALDDQGFRHFGGSYGGPGADAFAGVAGNTVSEKPLREAPNGVGQFLSELAEAMQKDLGSLTGSDGEISIREGKA